MNLPSKFQIGDKVMLDFFGSGFMNGCEITKVHFTGSKVLYDVDVLKLSTRLYNIDSVYVKPQEDEFELPKEFQIGYSKVE